MSVCSYERTLLHCFGVKWLLAIKLPLFSKIMQTKHHLKEFSERNLILARVVTLCIFEGKLSTEKVVPYETVSSGIAPGQGYFC